MRALFSGTPVFALVALVWIASPAAPLTGCGKVVYGDLDAAVRDHTARDRDPHAPDAAPACAAAAPCLITVAGSGKAGSTDGPALQAELDQPTGVAMGYNGELIVVDTANSIIRRLKGGQLSVMVGSGWGKALGPLAKAKFAYPEGIFSQGTVFLLCDTMNHGVRQVDPINVVDYAGSERGYAEGPAASARFDEPRGVTQHSSGAVYIADSRNNVIRTIEQGVVSTVVGDGTAGDKDGVAGMAQLNAPAGVAVDSAGKLYIADTDNNKIKVYNPGSNTVDTLAGDGYWGHADAVSGLKARFAGPEGLVVTPDGAAVYVADVGNSCIRKVTAGGSVTTVAGQCGKAGFADGAATTEALLDAPHGLTLTSTAGSAGSAALYIADTNNNRVRLFIPK